MMHKNAAVLMTMLGFIGLSLVLPCAAAAVAESLEKSLPSDVLMPALRAHHAGKFLVVDKDKDTAKNLTQCYWSTTDTLGIRSKSDHWTTQTVCRFLVCFLL
jgi:hypothetical protein